MGGTGRVARAGQIPINACRFIDVIETASLLRLLGDEVRLRMLRLLDAERLNVTELTAILGIAQSGVSRHLGLMKDAGLVEERREGGFTFFRLARSLETVPVNSIGPDPYRGRGFPTPSDPVVASNDPSWLSAMASQNF